jgi:hypothetical protein
MIVIFRKAIQYIEKLIKNFSPPDFAAGGLFKKYLAVLIKKYLKKKINLL